MADSCDRENPRNSSLHLMKKAIRTVITCPDFDINAEKAQRAVMCAQKLIEWTENNQDKSADFALALISSLRSCFSSSTARKCHKVREQMWEEYFKLCSSDNFRDAWSTLIIGTIGLKPSPVFYQYVTSKIFEDLIKDQFSVPESNSVSGGTAAQTSLSYEECNALRYSIGYVIRSLINKLTKSSHFQKEEMILCLRELVVDSDIATSEQQTFQSSDWTLLMDRGGLYHVSDNTFQLFVTMEMELRQCLSKFDSSLSKETVLEKILQNDDIFDQWYDVSINWGDESEDLLQMIAEKWITIRGFSHSSAFMEMYKQKNAKTIQKSKGLRKNLISNNACN